MAIAGHVSCFDIDYRNIHNRDKSEENRIDKAPSVEGSGPRAPGGINVRVIKDHPDIADLLYEEYLCALVAYLRNACVAEKALGYVSDVIVLVHSLILEVLRHLTLDERTRTHTKSMLLDKLRVM
ncbi:hypothetical protein CISG_04292 [Coccidioides immitis RMSCC 3703]|uniref:Uncharacterized protein n=1 Tax=Coccidioides immitis RMSCC 3703 TaxID=454286 RepID=A0A0J8QR85_COCIT|nr:hypothetical protein CISG_04292 [Coccidioides immitis RMSCC 3703]